MNINMIKLYRPVSTLLIPPKPLEGKNICLGFFGENVDFFQTYRSLNIKLSHVKHIFVPMIVGPVRSKLFPQYRKIIKNHKLLPHTGTFGDYTSLYGKNFYLDYSMHMDRVIKRYDIDSFHTIKALKRVVPLLNTFKGVPENEFQRILLYCVSLDEPLSKNIRKRRFFMIYAMLLRWFKSKNDDELPFDKILMFVTSATGGGRYILIFDKEAKNNNLSRIKSILLSMRMIDPEQEDEMTAEEDSEEITDDSEELLTDKTPESKERLKLAVQDYIKNNPELTGHLEKQVMQSTSPLSHKEQKLKNKKIAIASMLSHTTGDPNKAHVIANKLIKMDPDTQKKVIKKIEASVLPKYPPRAIVSNPLVKMANPEKIVEGSPEHILEKRKTDFKENLKEDVIDAFKVLSKKDHPVKISEVKIITIETGNEELKKSIKDQYNIKLKLEDGREQNVMVEFPHLTDTGVFYINGMKKILLNQIITYPIFFFKAYSGKFTSAYSTVSLFSKMLKDTSYLLMFMCGYKMPLIMFLAYKLGFDYTMKSYGVEYSIDSEKKDNSILLPGSPKKYINFVTKDDLGEQLVESFKYSLHALPKTKFDIHSQEDWQKVLENHVGNRNCIYLLNQVWENVVTPIEIKLLESRGDPTNIRDIVRYIAGEVVNGRIDDRNGLDRQRIRTSEIITSQLQKQILAAYNEYESKLEMGDKNAEIYLNPKKIFTEILQSQNIQMLENINPIEELSMMTRVTPIGIGGIPDKLAVPTRSLNTHPSYYGNIDPLETPDGDGVGIQQHLAIGAAITNIRGTFADRDRSKIKPGEILSSTVSMIPYVESNESTRVLMASGQSKQAVALKNPEIPATMTGFESTLTPLLSDSFIKKSPVNGVITEITDKIITIKDEKGELHNVGVAPLELKSGQGKNGLSLFKPNIAVGSNVKENQIIAEGSGITEGIITVGVNMLVAYMPWKGYNFEDGIILSESAAKKFTSLHLEEQSVVLSEEDDVEYIADMGSNVFKGHVLLTYSDALYDIESHKHLRSVGGKVADIEVYSNLSEDKIPEKIKSVYMDFKERYIKLHGSYPIGKFKDKGETIKGIMIKFSVQQELSLTKGDKLNNRHFNKGVISLIEKDENMPITPWGDRIEMMYNPISILNRMISGQLMEAVSGLIAKKLAEVMEKESRDKFTNILTDVLTLMDGTENNIYSKNTIKHIKMLSDSAYEKLKIKITNDRFFNLVAPPFRSPERDNIEKALKVLGLKTKYPLKLPEFNIVSDPVCVGYVYITKLEHLSEKKLSVRGVGPYVQKTMSPTQGKKRGGGQKIGEGDLYALLGWDCPVIIDEMFGSLSTDHLTKNQIISEIIQTGEGEFKQAKTNPVKELFSNMMLAAHLDAE